MIRQDAVQELSEELGTEVPYICIAEVYDALFHEARVMVKRGEDDALIQNRMDEMVEAAPSPSASALIGH